MPARHVEEWDPVGCPWLPQDTTPLFEDGALYGLAVRPEHHGHVSTSPPGEARGVALRVSPTPGAAEASYRVHFVRGLDNPADALTKSAKTTPMLDHLCAEAGLVQLTNTGAAVIQAVREVDVSAADGGGVDFASPSLSLVRPQKRVSFSMKVDGFWWLEDRTDRDQVYVIPLGLNSQKPVVVEICASQNSAIWQACRDRGLECISVTKEERNLLTRKTQKELYRLLQRDVPLWIHIISTPCTAGCRYRFLNRRRSRGNQYARQWKKVYAIHGEMWEFLGKFIRL